MIFLLVTSSGFQILSYLFNPSIEPKIACAIFGLFIFKRLSKQVLNALKTKKTRHIRAGFFACDLVRIQTWNLQSRNLMLYSVELRGRFRVQR